jgi:hypothetical protein
LRIVFFILSSILFAIPCVAQERFFTFLPGWFSTTIREYDNRYIAFGLDGEFDYHYYQFHALDKSGVYDTTWTFAIDTANTTSTITLPQQVLTLPESNYITGLIRGDSTERIYGTLMEFDDAFEDTVFTKAYDLSEDTRMQMVIPNLDGKLTTVGIQKVGPGLYHPQVYGMDLEGNIEWNQSFSCESNCEIYGYHIMQTPDKGYFFTCLAIYNAQQYNYHEKTIIFRLDSLGNEIYRMKPGDPELFTNPGWVVPSSDGNFFFFWSDPFKLDYPNEENNDTSTIWMQKFDIDGNLIFEKNYLDELPRSQLTDRGFNYYINKVINNENGSMTLVGFHDGPQDDGFLINIAQDGELQWYRFISPPQADGNGNNDDYTRFYSATATSDGGYILGGLYFSFPSDVFPEGMQTAFAAKVDEYGFLEPGCHLADNINEYKQSLGLQVFPNPARDQVTVSINHAHQIQSINLFDISGKVIAYPGIIPEPIPELVEGSSGYGLSFEVKLDVSSLISGLYLIEVTTKEGLREVKRVVISD